MFRDVPECSGMFHVPGSIDARFSRTLYTHTFFTYVSCCDSYLTLLMANIKSHGSCKYQKSNKNCNWFKLFEMSWLYSQYLTFHWKLLVLVSRIQKSGTGDNNFGKWKGTFRSNRPKWRDRSLWTTFKAGSEYSGRTKPKWSVPFDEPAEISGILGWMESAPGVKFKSASTCMRNKQELLCIWSYLKYLNGLNVLEDIYIKFRATELVEIS